MYRKSAHTLRFATLMGCLALLNSGSAQNTQQGSPVAGGYQGIWTEVPGIFLTPAAFAPFSATEHVVTHQKTADGSERVMQTTTHIARASSGFTYTERRQLLPPGSPRIPGLLEGQIYDPSLLRVTKYDPATHIARQTTLTRSRPVLPGPSTPSPIARPGIIETDLGIQTLEGIELRGLRRVRTIPATVSGTGNEVQSTDDYWFSPALSIYMIIRHEDPRTGEQFIALSDITQREPDNSVFQVPDSYKIVDETPLPNPSAPHLF